MPLFSISLESLRTILFKTFFALLLVTNVGIASAGMELQDLDTGAPVDLENIVGNGKWTLVMFWAIHCPICHEQKPAISAFHDKHKDSDAHVVGIALDGVEKTHAVKNYIVDNKVTFPSYVGDIGVIASHYLGMTEENLRGTPTYLLFNPEGELLGNNAGPLTIASLEAFIAR